MIEILSGENAIHYSSAVSDLIENLIRQGAVLIPQTKEDITHKLETAKAIVAVLQRRLAGYVSYTVKPEYPFLEVGSLVVVESYRGHGIGSLLVRTITFQAFKQYPNRVIYALTQKAVGSFLRSAYVELGHNAFPKPPRRWVYCQKCPQRPNDVTVCCNRLFVYQATLSNLKEDQIKNPSDYDWSLE